ncbi:MAG: dihydropyrimidinase [Bacilli bacterium]|nr:dihydropyrimidinase [Bacilli bacterium]
MIIKCDLLIKNGKVVLPNKIENVDIAVKDEKIILIGLNLNVEANEIVDASGKIVVPGAIDAHTHLAMSYKTTFSADDYFTGTRAALCGGTTSIIDYPCQTKGVSIKETLKPRFEMCQKDACADYSFHCAITDFNDGEILNEMDEACENGITSYKGYMVYKKEGMMLSDQMISTLLKRTKEVGAILNLHAENYEMLEERCQKYLKEGKTSPWYHYMSRPESVAAEADKRAIRLATNLKAPLYLVHMSDKEGLEAAIQAKQAGFDIKIETCPHYLEFTNEVYKRVDGINFVCSPPMKNKESQDALWKALNDGYIDTIATDHCPFKKEEKLWGKDDFTKTPNGCAGIENMYPYMLSKANEGKTTFETVVKVCSYNPAKIFGCKNKGSIEIGKDADIVIFDPNKDFVISVKNMHSNYDYTIWEGHKCHGYIDSTYLRGKLVFKDGKFLGKRGSGKFIKRTRYNRG